MKSIPDIVKEHVLKHQGRMPKTEQEINEYLDLINHAKEYAQAAQLEDIIGKKMMSKLGFKTREQVKRESDLNIKL